VNEDRSLVNPADPYDPKCAAFVTDMDAYDWAIIDFDSEKRDMETPAVSPQERIDYVIENEGTYNRNNGHFLCDTCYIKAGQPSSPRGWKCP
jgi:hypothetical protein